MANQLSLNSFFLNQATLISLIKSVREHVEATETYDPDPVAQKQKSHIFENMCSKVTFFT